MENTNKNKYALGTTLLLGVIVTATTALGIFFNKTTEYTCGPHDLKKGDARVTIHFLFEGPEDLNSQQTCQALFKRIENQVDVMQPISALTEEKRIFDKASEQSLYFAAERGLTFKAAGNIVDGKGFKLK